MYSVSSGLPWIDAAQVPSVVRYKLWSSEIFTLQTSDTLTFTEKTPVQFFTLQTSVMFSLYAANFGFVTVLSISVKKKLVSFKTTLTLQTLVK
jgi:hypothetical protein